MSITSEQERVFDALEYAIQSMPTRADGNVNRNDLLAAIKNARTYLMRTYATPETREPEPFGKAVEDFLLDALDGGWVPAPLVERAAQRDDRIGKFARTYLARQGKPTTTRQP